MTDTLPSFPVDDMTLNLVEHALGGRLTFEGDDYENPILIGAEFSLSRLLDFLSGYDPALLVPCEDENYHTHDDVFEYTGGPLYHANDVIQALIDEIRRLRTESNCDDSA